MIFQFTLVDAYNGSLLGTLGKHIYRSGHIFVVIVYYSLHTVKLDLTDFQKICLWGKKL